MSISELQNLGFREFAPGYYINKSGIVYSSKFNKYLATAINIKGYLTTTICINGKRKKIFNHIKVVEMFGDKNGNRIYPGLKSLLNHGISIDHVDGDKLNCRQSNLELVAHALNCQRYADSQKDNDLGF